MHVLFLTSHPLGTEALSYLQSYDGWDDISVKMTGELDPYPKSYDLGISFLYHYKIPETQLTPERVWLNFHPAPLPNYRGRNVAYHAILNGETWFGATLHYVDKTFDTGDIVQIRHFPIHPSDHAGIVAENARNACLELFKDYIPQFLMGRVPQGKKQSGGAYYKKSPINAEIDLTTEQATKIRAVTAPPHYAYVTIGGKRYDIIPAD
jgi:methionyl-tRNA formyltransferase